MHDDDWCTEQGIAPEPRPETPVMLTGRYGRTLRDITEPQHGSVVLTEGPFGTAWQRYFSDGQWRRVGGGRSRPWAWLRCQPDLVLVYDAPER